MSSKSYSLVALLLATAGVFYGNARAADGDPRSAVGSPRAAVSSTRYPSTFVLQQPFALPLQTAADGACRDSDASVHWTMDEASGDLTDECNGNVLLGKNCVSTAYSVTGINGTGSAIYQDDCGPSGFQSDADMDDADIGTADFVVEAWVKYDQDGAATQYLYSKIETSTPFKGHDAYVDPTVGTMAIQLDVLTENLNTVTCSPFSDNSWHLLRFEVDRDGNFTGYIDGQSCGTSAMGADSQGDASNDEEFVLFSGGPGPAGNDSMEGAIADFMLCKGASSITDCPDSFVTGIEGYQDYTEAYARAAKATRWDPELQLMQEVMPGVPPIGALVEEDEATLPASGSAVGLMNWRGGIDSYELLWNEDFSNAVWTETGVNVALTDEAVTAPNGSAFVDALEDNDAASVEKICQTVTVTSGADYTANMLYRAHTGTPTPVIELDGTQQTCAASDATWQYCYVSDSSASGTTIDMCIYPAGTTASSTGAIYAWRPQVFDERIPRMQFFLVEGSEVTPVGGWLYYEKSTETVFDMDNGTLCMWVDLATETESSVSTRLFQMDNTQNGGGNDARLLLSLLANGGSGLHTITLSSQLLADNFTAAETDVAGRLSDSGGWQHMCVTWRQSTSTVKFYKNGVLTETDTGDTWTADGETGNRISFLSQTGSAGTVGGCDTTISRVRLYKATLDDTLISAIYTAENTSEYAGVIMPIDPIRYARAYVRKHAPTPSFARDFTLREYGIHALRSNAH